MNYGLDHVVKANARLALGLATAQVINTKGQLVDIDETAPHFAEYVRSSGKVLLGHNEQYEIGKIVYFAVHARPVPCIAVVLEITHDVAWEWCRTGKYAALSLGGRLVRLGKQRMNCMIVERVAFMPDEISITDSPVCGLAEIHILYQHGRWIRPGQGNKEVKHAHC